MMGWMREFNEDNQSLIYLEYTSMGIINYKFGVHMRILKVGQSSSIE